MLWNLCFLFFVSSCNDKHEARASLIWQLNAISTHKENQSALRRMRDDIKTIPRRSSQLLFFFAARWFLIDFCSFQNQHWQTHKKNIANACQSKHLPNNVNRLRYKITFKSFRLFKLSVASQTRVSRHVNLGCAALQSPWRAFYFSSTVAFDSLTNSRQSRDNRLANKYCFFTPRNGFRFAPAEHEKEARMRFNKPENKSFLIIS